MNNCFNPPCDKLDFLSEHFINPYIKAFLPKSNNALYRICKGGFYDKRKSSIALCLRIILILTFIAGSIVCAQAENTGDPAWGFSVQSPQGWKYQKQTDGCLLEYYSIPGMIIVSSHMIGDPNKLQGEMAQGLEEDSFYLQLAGSLSPFGQSGFCGAYEGYWDEQQVKARSIGIISSSEGGAIVIAISTPQTYSEAIAQAAEAIAKSVSTLQADNSELIQHFAGIWKNSTKDTERIIFLRTDGTYADRYPSGYSGEGWGTAADQHGQGRWTVRGTREHGIFIFTYPTGQSEQNRYHVHIKNGQTYWHEYFIEVFSIIGQDNDTGNLS
jgi:hypothetical protein